MAITEAFQSSATIGTAEYWCAAGSTVQGSGQAVDGVHQCFVELNNLVAGDIFRIRAWDAISSGGTSRVIFEENIAGPVGTPLYVTPSLVQMHKWDFSLTKLSGTDRSIAWSIRKIA
jgi:hypothetical protein